MDSREFKNFNGKDSVPPLVLSVYFVIVSSFKIPSLLELLRMMFYYEEKSAFACPVRTSPRFPGSLTDDDLLDRD